MLRYLGIYLHDIVGFMENFRCMRSKKLFVVFVLWLPKYVFELFIKEHFVLIYKHT